MTNQVTPLIDGLAYSLTRTHNRLELCSDGAIDESGRPTSAWGFLDPASGVFITVPRLSPCSRFEVDPMTAYGLSEEEADKIMALNDALVQLRRVRDTEVRDGG